jgi:hypothetical protein
MEFTVTGRFPFPIDMLRYDRCYPATEKDSSLMVGALSGSREITLRLVTDRPAGPTEARWNSFMWHVGGERLAA